MQTSCERNESINSFTYPDELVKIWHHYHPIQSKYLKTNRTQGLMQSLCANNATDLYGNLRISFSTQSSENNILILIAWHLHAHPAHPIMCVNKVNIQDKTLIKMFIILLCCACTNICVVHTNCIPSIHNYSMYVHSYAEILVLVRAIHFIIHSGSIYKRNELNWNVWYIHMYRHHVHTLYMVQYSFIVIYCETGIHFR